MSITRNVYMASCDTQSVAKVVPRNEKEYSDPDHQWNTSGYRHGSYTIDGEIAEG